MTTAEVLITVAEGIYSGTLLTDSETAEFSRLLRTYAAQLRREPGAVMRDIMMTGWERAALEASHEFQAA